MEAVIIGGIVTVVLMLVRLDDDFNWVSTRAHNNLDLFIPEAVIKVEPTPKVSAMDDKEHLSGEGDVGEDNSQQESTVPEPPPPGNHHTILTNVWSIF